jgi:DNA-binding transcriptional regulator LsrR (DeoR family)
MNDNDRVLVKVANLYYQEDLNQSEIGAKLRLSRQKVQRLLKQAREEGIVQINIRPITGIYADLERGLERRYGLKEALVTETTAFDNPGIVEREVGSAAAEYLSRAIRPDDLILISWGGTLLGMVNALSASSKRGDYPPVKIIQGLGGLGDPTREVHASELTRRLAQLVGGEAILLPAPGVAGSREACLAYYEDPYIRQVLDLGRKASIAILGIGAPRQDSILIREGIIVSWSELEALRQK